MHTHHIFKYEILTINGQLSKISFHLYVATVWLLKVASGCPMWQIIAGHEFDFVITL